MHSNLTRGSLYGRRRPGPDPSWRRLRSLSLALLLVLLLMQQAGDPQVYRNLFTKLGVPLAGPTAVTVDATRPPQPTATVPASDLREIDSLAPRLVESLDGEMVDELTATLARARRDETTAADLQVLTRLRGALQQFRRSLPQSPEGQLELDAWIAALEPPVAPADVVRVSQWLQPALDGMYLRHVHDASVWHAEDATALFRYLERAQDPATLATSTPTGVLPLLDQADLYRGQPFQMTGRAVRAEKIARRANPFGIDAYWMVWLNPEDGSNRPAVFYAPAVPEAVERLPAAVTALDGPRVTARGVYLKRLLYQSSAGAETAPVLVGRLSSEEPLAVAPSGEPAVPLWLIVASASAIGIAAAAWVYWTSARQTRRRRTLRETGRPIFDADRSLASLKPHEE